MNRDARLERSAAGELILLIVNWWKAPTPHHTHAAGLVTGNWSLIEERWDALTPEQQEGFAPLCPDFVVERRH